jgi:hypothetical protein
MSQSPGHQQVFVVGRLSGVLQLDIGGIDIYEDSGVGQHL